MGFILKTRIRTKLFISLIIEAKKVDHNLEMPGLQEFLL